MAAKDRDGWYPVDQVAGVLTTTPEELRVLSRRGRLPKIEGGQLPLVKTAQAYTRHLRTPIVTMDEAGEKMGVTRQMLGLVIADGFIERVEGGIDLIAALSGYIRWLRDDKRRSTKVAAESGLKAARQREVELRIAREENRLIEAEEAFAILDEIVGTCRAEFGGLAARTTRDIPLRRKIEVEVNGCLKRISDLLAKRERDVRASGAAAQADAEADA